MIPIIIISYNNYKYVANTVRQLLEIDNGLKNWILIMDNNSDDYKTKEYLGRCGVRVHYNQENKGPWVTPEKNAHIWNMMPEKFILTDPDLEFNKNLPVNFIEILMELSDRYKCEKIGFGLRVNDHQKWYQGSYYNMTLYEWEKQFWVLRIPDPKFELYNSRVDTTFCVVNKRFKEKFIRVGKNFTARHLPWYIEDNTLSVYDKYYCYNRQTGISTIKELVLNHLRDNYEKFEVGGEVFFVGKNSKILDECRNFFGDLNITELDNIINSEKYFLEIGDDVGMMSVYLSRKCKGCIVLTRKNTYGRIIKDNTDNVSVIEDEFGDNFLDLLEKNGINLESIFGINLGCNLSGVEEKCEEYGIKLFQKK